MPKFHMKARSWEALLFLCFCCLLSFYLLLSSNQGPTPPHQRAVPAHQRPVVNLKQQWDLESIKGVGSETTAKPKFFNESQTADGWPIFSRGYFNRTIPPSPFHPNFTITWDVDTDAFLKRPHVQGKPPKLMTWIVKTRYQMPLPEPVRLRVCSNMPCRLTTERRFAQDSAALLWAGQIMRDARPPPRSHPDQVFVFHNHEPQTPEWIRAPSFRRPAWRDAFNWTMTYRADSDVQDLYGKLIKHPSPVEKNYTAILATKTRVAAWMNSHCPTHGARERYVKLLKQHIQIDGFGGCGAERPCPRSMDDACERTIGAEYKFYLAFENAFCRDYVSEKFFRWFNVDIVVVARGAGPFAEHAPPGTYINTADFPTAEALARHLQHLDAHPEQYLDILRAKDRYLALYEDWPIRGPDGEIHYMHYHFEAIAFCELCMKLWDLEANLEANRKHVENISEWFDSGNCYPPTDIR